MAALSDAPKRSGRPPIASVPFKAEPSVVLPVQISSIKKALPRRELAATYPNPSQSGQSCSRAAPRSVMLFEVLDVPQDRLTRGS